MNILSSNRTKTCQFCGHALRRVTPGFSGYMCLLKRGEQVAAEDTCDQFENQEWTTLASKVKKK